MGQWVDFKELRQSVELSRVLEHYGVELKTKGRQAQGFCPLPTHEGNRRSPSFSVNLEKGIWQCFGCKASGNVLDFAARMEGLDPQDKGDLRKAALLVQERFTDTATGEAGKEASAAPAKKSTPEPEAEEPSEASQHVINAPLDFELKKLDPHHPYLRERGLEPHTIAHFGLGHCTRGLIGDRHRKGTHLGAENGPTPLRS